MYLTRKNRFKLTELVLKKYVSYILQKTLDTFVFVIQTNYATYAKVQSLE